jgi:hypothetical protein
MRTRPLAPQAPRAHSPTHSPQRAFTLVELLLGSFLGTLIATSVYKVFVSTSSYYARQLEQTQARSGGRFALEHLKAELRDLGRLSILNLGPGARDPLYCGNRLYAGVELIDNDGGGSGYERPALLSRNQIAPDRLRLLIDASDATPLRVESAAGGALRLARDLQQPSLAARRLVSPGAEGRFAQLFDVNALARVTQASTGRYDLVPVQVSGLANGVGAITLASPPCAELNCNAGGCLVNPVHWVEYAVLSDPDEPDRTRLSRRRLDPQGGDALPNTELSLAEYVVNFQVWGDYDTRGGNAGGPVVSGVGSAPLVPSDPLLRDDRGNWAGQLQEGAVMNKWPHRLRGINALMSVRESRLDPTLPAPANAPNELAPQEVQAVLVVTPRGEGYARVSSVVGGVETPNLYRGD